MKKIITNFENSLNELFALETIIIITKEVCSNKEFNSVYYNIPTEYKIELSEERNHYINMLTIALDKICEIKESLILAENEFYCLQ